MVTPLMPGTEIETEPLLVGDVLCIRNVTSVCRAEVYSCKIPTSIHAGASAGGLK